jgi:hypothetical protein
MMKRHGPASKKLQRIDRAAKVVFANTGRLL